MDTSTVQITEIIPQRRPFVFIDSLLQCGESSALTSFEIREDNIFVRNGVFQTSGLIENIAQSCVSKIGYCNKFVEHKKVTIGYIGNVHHLKVNRNPKVGETIHTAITFGDKIAGIQICEAVVSVGDEIIAQSSIKTAQNEEMTV